MITIVFESHATTRDNEDRLASGHYDVELSSLGETQARQMGERYIAARLDAVFCSDLQRSYRTAEIAFARMPHLIRRDSRLRECDYGDWTRQPMEHIERERLNRLNEPFPNGESYRDCVRRMGAFLHDVRRDNTGGHTILIVGHRATQYGLEHILGGVPLEDVLAQSWAWQPGWTYLCPEDPAET